MDEGMAIMKRSFTIIRCPSFEDGTFGMMLDGKLPFCLTLERKWLNNKKGDSCIPNGIYLCKRITSPKFGNTFEITNVPNRTEILFHKGNIVDDSHGCIILGEQFEPIRTYEHGLRNGILSSGKAFDEFIERTSGLQEFNLYILWAKWK